MSKEFDDLLDKFSDAAGAWAYRDKDPHDWESYRLSRQALLDYIIEIENENSAMRQAIFESNNKALKLMFLGKDKLEPDF